MGLIRELVAGAVDLIYPPVCCLCAGPAFEHGDICTACRTEILTDPFEACPRCGRSVGPHTRSPNGCYQCVGERFAFDTVIRLGPYEGRRRELVLRAKRDELAAECAAALLTEGTVATLKVEPIDCVIPVPLHWHRGWRRGYNQSAVLARALASGLGVASAARSLRRIRSTPPQPTMSPAQRRENVRGAFATRRVMRNATVVLVDDVMTTGATADAAARALRLSGAVRVIAVVVAHG